jgi:hypothetical protein
LHFQIDKNTAPWNPFWPFTGTEARDAGLSFTEAINNGLGKTLGYEHTINPMVYVQRYFAPGSSLVADAGVTDSTFSDVVEGVSRVAEDLSVELASNFEIKAPTVMIKGNSYEVEIVADNVIAGRLASLEADNFKFRSNLIASYTTPRVMDFTNGQVRLNFTPKELGNMNMVFTVNDNSYYSSNVEVRLFADLPNSDSDLSHIFKLKEHKIIEGYNDGTFRPDNLVNKAEAAKFIVESLPEDRLKGVTLVDINFTDVSVSDWYYEYIQVLASLGAIDTDRPEYEATKPVNLAELLKLIYIAFGADVSPNVDALYVDMFGINEWYSSFVALALEQNIVTESEVSRIGNEQLRRDVSRIMSKLIELNS